MAHEIRPGDMTPDAARRIEPDAFLSIDLRRKHDLPGNDAVLEDLLIVIEIVDEQVERVDALLETFLDAAPFGGRHDARDEVERENLLRSGAFAIDFERDAHLEQRAFGGLLAVEQFAVGEALDVFYQGAGGRSGLVVFTEELIEELVHLIVEEAHNQFKFGSLPETALPEFSGTKLT